MARADVYTIMPLDRWAELVGLNPVHFNGAYGEEIWPLGGNCQFVWPQYAWQTEEQHVNREYLAQTLHQAELQIAQIIGYYHAPQVETQRFPWRESSHTYRTTRGNILRAGTARVEFIANRPVTYVDVDEDGLEEVAEVTCTLAADIAYTDVHAYFTGKQGNPKWEIRPVELTSTPTGVKLTFRRWQAIDPALQMKAPQSDQEMTPINIEDVQSVVGTVDLYVRTFSNDHVYVQHIPTCDNCEESLQACLRPYRIQIIDWRTGLFKLNHMPCDVVPLCACGRPTGFELTYESGLQEPDHTLEYAIALLALARLNNPPCTCSAVIAQYNKLHIDMADRRNQHFLTLEHATSPLGTLNGEIFVWNTIQKLGMFQSWVGAIA